jgi:hypothetical protein
LGLVIFYNFERLTIGDQMLLDVQAWSYGLVFLAVVSTIAFPFFTRIPAWAGSLGWVLVYMVGAFWAFDIRRAQLGDMCIYVLIAEAASVYVLSWLASRVAANLHEFVQAVEQLSVPDADEWVVNLEDARNVIQTEINRTLRYERPLSIVCFQPEFDRNPLTLNRLIREIQERIVHHFVIVNLGRIVKWNLRRTDVVTLEDQRTGRFVVLCPETDSQAASALAKRVIAVAHKELGLPIVWGSAMFPEDTSTFEEAVGLALKRLSSHDDDVNGIHAAEGKAT